MGESGFAEIEAGIDVEGHRLPPLLGADLIDSPEAWSAGIVYQHIQPAKMLDRPLDGQGAIFRLGHIEALAMPLAPRSCNGRHGLLRLRAEVPGTNRNVRSSACEVDCYCRPNSHCPP